MSRFTLALGIALLVVEASAAIALIATNDQAETTWTTLALALTAGTAFVVSGLIALMRRPENRTGVYLAAIGYVWFLSALGDSANDWLFTVGFVIGDLIWVPFTALVLAYPTGRLESRLERALPIAVGVLLTTPAVLTLMFDPSPALNRCEECPGSAIVVSEQPGLGAAFNALASAISLGLIVLVITFLVRRWRGASPALRRLLWPVVGAGVATLLSIGAVVIADRISGSEPRVLQLLFFVAFSTVPLAFLFGVLRTRLARSSVSEVVVALQAGTPLRDAIARALNDPSLELVYRLDSGGWIDPSGRGVPNPAESAGRKVTTVTRDGQPVAALVHDASLAEEPELIDAITAAAGLSLHNERLQAELRAQYTFLETITDTVPSLLVNVDTEGRIVNHNQAAVSAAGHEDEEDVRGRHFWDVFIDESEREAMKARFAAAAPDFAAAEYENTFTNARGERLVIYWRNAPVVDERGNVASIVSGGLDVTDRYRQEEEKKRERDFLFAIANNAPSLICVIDEKGRVAYRRWDQAEHKIGATNIAFERLLGHEPRETGSHVFWERFVDAAEAEAVKARIERVVGGEVLGEHDNHWVTSTGRRLVIAWTCTPLPRVDERTLFLISGVDVTERKGFEDEIRASRARLVRAEDEARRELERNLHDGAQQRLVALSVALRLVESKLETEPDSASTLLGSARDELMQALEELRELARGIHPAVLTDRGLRPALEALAGRAPIPIALVAPAERMPPEVEAAAYYVVAESLTNIAKYASASSANVSVVPEDGVLAVTIADDGVGGADPTRGTGLRGLVDRVAVLDGSLVVESPVGGGTTIRAEIPLSGATDEK